jgi:hypothetical protein
MAGADDEDVGGLGRHPGIMDSRPLAFPPDTAV